MDLVLVEKFLHALAAPETKQPVSNVFDAMKLNPAQMVMQGLQYVNRYIKKADAEGHSACINGILFGINLAVGVDKSPELRKLMNDYLDQKKLENGENVIDFFEKRAEKKK